ncbi:MAG: hypothetical protein WBV76_06420, partial [Pseudolabrys sp.]
MTNVRFTPESGHNRRIEAPHWIEAFLACVICHAAAAQIRQTTSPSGRLTKIRTTRITVVARNAASWP